MLGKREGDLRRSRKVRVRMANLALGTAAVSAMAVMSYLPHKAWAFSSIPVVFPPGEQISPSSVTSGDFGIDAELPPLGVISQKEQGEGSGNIELFLKRFPDSKRQEFLDRPWQNRDTVMRTAREEGVRAGSILGAMIAGRLAVNALMSVTGNKGAYLVTWGLQTAFDFATASSMQDFRIRAFTNALDKVIPETRYPYLREGFFFAVGHMSLFNNYWPEVRSQLSAHHEGVRRIRFLSPELDQRIDLELMAPQSTNLGEGEGAQFVIHFDRQTDVVDQPVVQSAKGLNKSWLSLAKACQDHGVTSLRIRPNSDTGRTMHVQLWRGEKMLSETSLVVSLESNDRAVWLSDWLIRKSWPDTHRPGSELLVNPLVPPVLSAIEELVVEGTENTVVLINDFPSIVAPEARLALFATGDGGYLLADKNTSVDVELPELWLNTEDAFHSDMKVVLARLEQHQVPGQWRGAYGLGAELARSYITRSLIHAGVNWFRGGSPSSEPVEAKCQTEGGKVLPDKRYSEIQADRSRRKAARKMTSTKSSTSASVSASTLPSTRVNYDPNESLHPRVEEENQTAHDKKLNVFHLFGKYDQGKNVMLPANVWSEVGQYKHMKLARPDLWTQKTQDFNLETPISEKDYYNRFMRLPGEIIKSQ